MEKAWEAVPAVGVTKVSSTRCTPLKGKVKFKGEKTLGEATNAWAFPLKSE